MVKILFICYGNICRSPMAEFIMKDLVESNGLGQDIYVESAATSSEEIGNDIYYKAESQLRKEKIPYSHRMARKITEKDYDEFDYIIGMEDNNVRDILEIVGADSERKVYKLLDFSENPRDISDPWYTRNFQKAFDDIKEGCEALLRSIT